MPKQGYRTPAIRDNNGELVSPKGRKIEVKCQSCTFVKVGKSKMVNKTLRQGMSNAEVVVKFTRMEKVSCKKCHRVTWLPEDEVPVESQNHRIGQVFDAIEANLVAQKKIDQKMNKELNAN